MIRVFIIEPFAVLRHGLRLVLQEDRSLTVIGEAATATEALGQAGDLEPDVILTEIRLPDQGGVGMIERLRRMAPRGRILVLTSTERSDDIVGALKAGARGYLLKDITGAELVRAIHQVACGEAALPPQLAARLLDELTRPTATAEPLTDREMDVLHCVTKGWGNKEIATALNISQNTVKTHVRRILTKLNLRSRTEAATYALQQGLLIDQ